MIYNAAAATTAADTPPGATESGACDPFAQAIKSKVRVPIGKPSYTIHVLTDTPQQRRDEPQFATLPIPDRNKAKEPLEIHAMKTSLKICLFLLTGAMLTGCSEDSTSHEMIRFHGDVPSAPEYAPLSTLGFVGSAAGIYEHALKISKPNSGANTPQQGMPTIESDDPLRPAEQ